MRSDRLHALATMGMAVCALAGIVATVAFVTVRWPGATAGWVKAAIAASIVGFVVCAGIAVLAAAGAGYEDPPPGRPAARD